MVTLRSLLRRLLSCLAPVLAATGLHAQTALSGDVDDGHGGPLVSGQVYVASSDLHVPTGLTLTVQASAILKLSSAEIAVDGTLAVAAMGTLPATFTSLADDSVGGDTNGDGPSAGAPGDWAGIDLGPDGTLDASGLVVAYGGLAKGAAIVARGGSLRLELCTVRSSAGDGLDLSGSRSVPALLRSRFEANAGRGIDQASLDAVGGFTDLELAGNGAGDLVRVTDGLLGRSLVLDPHDCPNGALEVATAVDVGAGLTLRVDAATRLVQSAGSASGAMIEGSLELHGGPDHRAALEGGWQLQVRAGGSLAMRFAEVTGGTIRSTGGTILLHDSELHGVEVDLGGLTQGHSIERSLFDRGSVTGATFEILPSFHDNHSIDLFQGWPLPDTLPIGVEAGPLVADAAVRPENLFSATIIVDHLDVPHGRSLAIGPGIQLLLNGPSDVHGSLDLVGTGGGFVALTSNPLLNGGIGYDWGGLHFHPDAEASRLENVVIDDGSLMIESAQVAASSIVQRNATGAYGIDASALAGEASTWLATGNSGVGIELAGGSFDLLHATSVANGTGIAASGGDSGKIVDSIAWDDGANANAAAASLASYCDGFGSPVQGNFDADPLFDDELHGDFHLTESSPCVDRGHPRYGTLAGADMDENPHVPGGSLLPDLGVFERTLWHLDLRAPLFHLAPEGSSIELRVEGTTGAALLLAGPPEAGQLVQPFGNLLVSSTPILLGLVPVGSTRRLRVCRTSPAFRGPSSRSRRSSSPRREERVPARRAACAWSSRRPGWVAGSTSRAEARAPRSLRAAQPAGGSARGGAGSSVPSAERTSRASWAAQRSASLRVRPQAPG